MRPGKRYLLVFLSAMLACLATVPAINLAVDYHRVLSRDFGRHYETRKQNTSFLKTAYLLAHKDEFDSVVFGSSLVRYGIDTDDLERNFGGSWFKLDYPGGIPRQHMVNLRALVNGGFSPKNVLLLIDEGALTRDPEILYREYNNRPPPLTLRETIGFYIFYLFKKPGAAEWAVLRGQKRLKPYARIAGERHGLYARKGPSGPRAHHEWLRGLPPSKVELANADYAYTDAVLEDLEAFVRLARDNGASVRIVYAPLHYKSLIARNFDAMERFKRGLARLSPFHDFSGPFPHAMDSSLWRETRHFFPRLGGIVLDTVAKDIARPGEFGTLVDTGNIDRHLARIRAMTLASIPGLMRRDRMIFVSDSLLAGQGLSLLDAPLQLKATSSRPAHWTLQSFPFPEDQWLILKIRYRSRAATRIGVFGREGRDAGAERWALLFQGRFPANITEVHIGIPGRRAQAPVRFQFLSDSAQVNIGAISAHMLLNASGRESN